MNEKDRKEYLERYKKHKERGVPFFPDAIFKDAIVSLLVFIVLVALAYFSHPAIDNIACRYRPAWRIDP